MRKSLLDILRCPVCAGNTLSLSIEEENEQEVRSGLLACPDCGHQFTIVHGVAELLSSSALDEATLREREARDDKKRDWNIERQRPYISDDSVPPWVFPSFAANVEQGLAQIPLENRLVLDIGAATCWSTRMICERGAQAVAMDISTGILRDGEAQFSTGVFFDRVAGDMNALPFDDGGFDVVFMSATLHHSGDIQRTVGELARVLRPKGHIILVNEPVLGRLRRAAQFGQEEIERGMNEHIYRLSEYLTAMRSAGMEARVLFPAAMDRQLKREIPSPDTPAMRLASRFWPMLPGTVQRWSVYPGHMLLGLTLIMVSVKQ